MAEPTMSRQDDDEARGRAMYALIERLYPVCRSITGNGVRETLRILQEFVPLELHEVPSGTPVLDWSVPREWNIREAWIEDPTGNRVVDFRDHNLHVMSYSVPVRARMSLEELRSHLHSLPDAPDLIPYRTSYYREAWGFCLTHERLQALRPGEYEVCIDSTLEAGSLSYGELLLPGDSTDEVLISTHVCHPSLADDNLSGVAVATFLARDLLALRKRRLSVRLLFAPGTIGAITWLARNRERTERIKHGLTLTCLGDHHGFTYKRTLAGDTSIDRAVEHALETSGLPHESIDFFPYGYDERQYNTPGFRLAVGSLMRGRHGRFREYHSSADDLDFVSPARLVESLRVVRSVFDVLDGDARYKSLAPYGEPQLGQRGLYDGLGGSDIPDLQLALLWVLCLSDGAHSLLDIARRARMDFHAVRSAADRLLQHELLEPLSESSGERDCRGGRDVVQSRCRNE